MSLVGSWQLNTAESKSCVDPSENSFYDWTTVSPDNRTVYVFTETTLTTTYGTYSQTWNYTLSGNTLTFSGPGSNPTPVTVHIEGFVLTLTFDYRDDVGCIVVYTLQRI